MTKQAGMGMRLYIDGYSLGGDVASFQRIAGGPAGTQDMTDITMSAMARAGLNRTGGYDFTGFFDDATDQLHARMKGLVLTDQNSLGIVNPVLGGAAFAVLGKQLNYDPTRPADGSLTIAATMESNGYGLEWGRLLTADVRTDTGAANGAGVDHLAATAFGLQAYLQVTEFTGTDVTVKIQESADDAAGDPYADVVGGGFTQVTTGTDPQAQRIQTARGLAVERWLRVVTVTTGGFSSLSFVVMVVKNTTEVLF